MSSESKCNCFWATRLSEFSEEDEHDKDCAVRIAQDAANEKRWAKHRRAVRAKHRQAEKKNGPRRLVAAQRLLYANNGAEMVRLLQIFQLVWRGVAPVSIGDRIDAVLKAVKPPRTGK